MRSWDRTSLIAGMCRSLLFVPGHSASKLVRASQSAADAIIADWEDGVPPDQKAVARQTTLELLRSGQCRPPLFIRANASGTSEYTLDVGALMQSPPSGVVLSKCRCARDVAQLSDALDVADPDGRCTICPLIESPEGVLNALQIAAASRRVWLVAFGAEDFSAAMRIHRSADEHELLYARSAVVLASRAAGKEPVDSPYLAYGDDGGLSAAASRARNLGFTGMLAIHPNQVDCINSAFRPSDAEVAEARRVVDLYASAGGATGIEGKMVDEAVVRAARMMIERLKPEQA
jgi:citrate lyase subunit beta/citryl-CoA lyase